MPYTPLDSGKNLMAEALQRLQSVPVGNTRFQMPAPPPQVASQAPVQGALTQPPTPTNPYTQTSVQTIAGKTLTPVSPTLPKASGATVPYTKGRYKDGSNTLAHTMLAEMQQKYGVTNQGIWGDQAHKARKSDHNTGDAVDMGVKTQSQGLQVVADALKQPGVKYVIFGPGTVYYPSGKVVPHGSKFDHSTHVHVSFVH